jgi:hypothetical protein
MLSHYRHGRACPGDPRLHLSSIACRGRVDARIKSGHDELVGITRYLKKPDY